MKDNFLNENLNKNESGFILPFALIVVAVLLLVSLSVSRSVFKEVFFARLVDYSRSAYFAADSGIECTKYIDSVLRDETKGISLFLNSTSTSDSELDFNQNAIDNVFFATSSIPASFMDSTNYKSKIFCSSDGSYNRIFNDDTDEEAGFVSSRDEVISNLNNQKSSFSIIGDSLHATTTFGFIVKGVDTNDNEVSRCVLVDFVKTRDTTTGLTSQFSITSTGYSSCNNTEKSRVSRTIYISSDN